MNEDSLVWTPPYEMPPYRPPSEAYSMLLRATRGCPWNRCAFCGMYKRMRFGARSVEEILADIGAARDLYGVYVASAFIGDSDALVLPPDNLRRVLEALYTTFPRLERVTAYARARTLLKRKPEDLRRLREAGLVRLHVGLESGDDVVLRSMDKGVTAEDAVAAGLRAKEAGFSLSFYVVLGLGGSERWREHAAGTAAVINRVDPDYVRLRTLWAEANAPLAARVERGEFRPASKRELLEEARALVAGLTDATSQLESDHVSNLLPLRGRLPANRERLVAMVDRAIGESG